MTNRPIVISFFDYTAIAVRPWAEAGFDVYCYDLQHEGLRRERVGFGSISYVHADLSRGSGDWYRIVSTHARSNVAFVFGFPPCTDLAVSGARHFASKRAANPMFQHDAVAMAKEVEVAAFALNAPYLVENPVSVLATMWRKPDHTFNPCDYGGYLPEDHSHPLWPEYIPARDAYTKRTCLWTGNGFVMPEQSPVEPIILSYTRKDGSVTKGSPQWGKLGGKSLKTKNIRNATPCGFALAVFRWNCPPLTFTLAA
nr:hypothetical protein [uncultured Sphingomonas sp.]